MQETTRQRDTIGLCGDFTFPENAPASPIEPPERVGVPEPETVERTYVRYFNAWHPTILPPPS